MPKGMSRNPHAFNACSMLHINQQLFDSIRRQWLTIAIDKDMSIFLISRLAILMNILPEQLSHIRRDANLTFLIALTNHPNIIIMHILYAQTAQLRDTNTRL